MQIIAARSGARNPAPAISGDAAWPASHLI